MRRDALADEPLLTGAPRRARDEAEAWRLGLVVLDQAFDAARARHGDAVPCRRGCSSCCAGLFEIHAADAASVALAVGELPPRDAARARQRAAAFVATVEHRAAGLVAREPLLSDWRAADGLSVLPRSAFEALGDGIDLPCPLLLDDGACGIHAGRPAICRLQGLPWRDPVTGEELPDGCRLDARQAGLPAVDAPLLELDELREGIRVRLGTRSAGGVPPRTFIAEAVLRADR